MRFLLPLLTIFWLAAPSLAQPLNTERLAEQLLETGADGIALADLARAPAQAEIVDALGAERSDLLRRAWQRAFAYDAVRADVVGRIAAQERGQSVAGGLDWLRRPDVRRAVDRMREATGEGFDQRFGAWMMAVQNGEIDLDTERIEYIILISERSGEDRIGEVVLSLAEASIRGAHAAAPRGDRPPLDQAMQRLRELGPTLTAQAVVQNQLYLYHVLDDLSPGELEAYAAALDMPNGRWYVRTMADAVGHALQRSSERLVREVEALLPRR